MSDKTTKPNTSNKATKAKNSSKGRPVSMKHISLPGSKQIKMNFTRWVMLITLILLLILVLVTHSHRAIRNDIKALESQDEIVAYCTENNLNCTFSVLSDYDIEGYKVARVAFLDDDFFGPAVPEAGSGSESKNTKQQENVYITIQKGQTVDVPSEA